MGSQWILVVDDEWVIGELVIFLLESHGYQVRYASNGAAALEMLDASPVDWC